jgi:hypothetical protein
MTPRNPSWAPGSAGAPVAQALLDPRIGGARRLSARRAREEVDAAQDGCRVR